jgi:hypothetical protein
MEPVVAIVANRSQIRSAEKRLRDAKTVAVGCDQLPKEFHGKEGSSAVRVRQRKYARSEKAAARAIV